MRYAIVSDIHANLAAWKNVLTDIADMKVDKIICLGDVVGYGPDPVGVLESVYRVVHVTLMGNHDAAVCGLIDPCLFSPRAQEAVLRHREQLSKKGIDWLSRLPLVLSAPGFRCAHGDFSAPSAFNYIIDPDEALASWKVTSEQLLFVGHSHLPGIYVIRNNGAPHFVNACDFQMEDDKRYIVNPGSIGYPRVGDCRSSYCIFDDAEKSISFRTLPFDCEGYRKALTEARLSDDPWMVQKETQHHLPTLRERLSFAHPLTQDQRARNVREHATLTPKQVRRHMMLLSLFIVFAAGGASWAAFHVGRGATPLALAVCVPDYDLPSLAAYPLSPPDKNLLPALPSDLAPDGRLAGWRYAVEDRRRQSLGTGLRDGELTLRITHAKSSRVYVETPLINLAGTNLRAVRMRGRVHKLDDFSGTVFYQLTTYVTRPDDTLEQDATQRYEARKLPGKTAASAGLSRKIEIPTRATHVRFRIEAEFEGTVEIERPLLTAADATPSGRSQTKASAE